MCRAGGEVGCDGGLLGYKVCKLVDVVVGT